MIQRNTRDGEILELVQGDGVVQGLGQEDTVQVGDGPVDIPMPVLVQQNKLVIKWPRCMTGSKMPMAVQSLICDLVVKPS